MAKKHFGKFMAFAAIAGTAAAGISYFLRYKSFHKELDEDFHDFEDDFDEDLKEFGDTQEAGKPLTRNYVPLGTDRQSSGQVSEAPSDSELEQDIKEVQEEEPDGSEPTAEPAADAKEDTLRKPEQSATTITEDTAE